MCCNSWGRKESDTTERLNRRNSGESFSTCITLIGFLTPGCFDA